MERPILTKKNHKTMPGISTPDFMLYYTDIVLK